MSISVVDLIFQHLWHGTIKNKKKRHMQSILIFPHQELLYELWIFGITRPLWSWINAYLSNRMHFIIDSFSSNLLPVHSGVPQGCILGSILFLIYTNDISNVATLSSSCLFVDDTKFIKSIASFPDRLEL